VAEPSGGAGVEPGLCGDCRHARVTRSARGGEFVRCRLADREPRFRRYPALPVRACEGYQPAGDAGPLLR
jgi:hypothetical protein